jgi:hypothetical protein
VVIKELRITCLADIWFDAARSAGYDIATVIPVRHPGEVVASIAARDNLSPEHSSALWLKYNLLAERHTREVPRAFVEYANLLADWRHEVTRISAALEIDLSVRDDTAIEEFLQPTLRRQRLAGPVPEPFGTDWISAVYTALCRASRDEPWDQSEMNRVYEAYRASERGHWTAFEGFRRIHDSVPSRLLRPPVQKLFLELFALAHRRNETWTYVDRRP